MKAPNNGPDRSAPDTQERLRWSFRGSRLLIDHLRAGGYDLGDLVERAGLPPGVLQDEDMRVSREPLERLWKVAIERTGDPALALRVASEVRANSFGLFAYLAATSESRRDGFERVKGIVGLMADGIEVRLSLTDDAATVSLHYHGFTPQRESSEYAVGVMVCMSRIVSALPTTPGAALFIHRAPPHAAEYERILGVPVRFEEPHNGVVFPRAQMDLPNPDADTGLREVMEQHAAALLEKLPRGQPFAERVLGCIRPLLAAGTPSVDEVAAALRMSPRTLRRRLEREDTTYRSVLDDLRREIALRALQDEHRTVEEAARLTGFSDASAFHKAFRRWTGRSPARITEAKPDA